MNRRIASSRCMLLGAGCLTAGLASLAAPAPVRGAVAHAGQLVMGTVLEVTVVASDAATARRLADAAVMEGRRWDDVLTTWRPEGELARLNARAGSGEAAVSASLAYALRRMKTLALATGGAFDPAVGPLVQMWQHPAPPPLQARRTKGDSQRISTALTLRGRKARLAVGAMLDAGGIGKGLALDAIAKLLQTGGAEAAFLDFGGSSQLAWSNEEATSGGWQVAVAGLVPGIVHGAVQLCDRGLSTSRTTEAGNTAGPIIDPRTQEPVKVPRMVTVLAEDATTAEAWSTALVVLGRDGLARLSEAHVEALFEDDDGLQQTAGFPLLLLDVPGRSRSSR